jgi:hypothetical protein
MVECRTDITENANNILLKRQEKRKKPFAHPFHSSEGFFRLMILCNPMLLIQLSGSEPVRRETVAIGFFKKGLRIQGAKGSRGKKRCLLQWQEVISGKSDRFLAIIGNDSCRMAFT